MNPLHLAPTRPQRAALVMSRPRLQAWFPPRQRPRATPPCLQPPSCTTPVDTVPCPPISVSGTCRTLAQAEATHTLLKQKQKSTGPSGTRMGHVHARGTLIFVYFVFYYKSALVRRLHRGNMYHIVNIVNKIGKAHLPIGCYSLSVLGVDVLSMVAISLFPT